MSDITKSVRINSSTEIELREDAKKGDVIHLDQLVEVNLLPLQDAIKNGKDKLYLQSLASEQKKWESQAKAELSKQEIILKEDKSKNEEKLKASINQLNTDNRLLSQKLEQQEKEIAEKVSAAKIEKTNELQKIIHELELEKQSLSSSLEQRKKGQEDKFKLLLSDKEKEWNKNLEDRISREEKDKRDLEKKISDLTNERNVLKATKEQEIQNKLLAKDNEKNTIVTQLKNEIDRNKAEAENKLMKQKQEDTASYQKLLDSYNSLRMEKSSHNVKRLGEGLEKWCNDEYQQYSLSGFNRCLWLKDNAAVREDGTRGAGGTKADYIFGVFANDEDEREVKELYDRKKNPSMEKARTSVIRDRKNEDPNSTNKKTNASYFAKLDQDRKKKNCEYALLVSELEMDSENYSFITKAQGYDKRYVVRPPYLRTFLSMLYSLTDHYRYILNKKGQEELKLKSRQELMDEFDSLKETYFEKPLAQMEKDREAILKNCASIEKSNNEIKTRASDVLLSKIGNRRAKIETFELKKRKTLVNKAEKIKDE